MGSFRADLYYRLSVIQLDLPPLRARGEDVLELAQYFIKHFNQKLNKQVHGLMPEVAALFRRYAWPGNVRELRNVIERVMILEDDELITPAYLPLSLARMESVAPAADATPVAAPVVTATTIAEVAARAPLAITPPILETVPLQKVTLDTLFRLPATGVRLEEVELSLVRQAVERSQGNQARAAGLLGISRDQLRYRMKKIEEAP